MFAAKHNDAGVIRDVLGGDRERFGLLVQRYLPVVYAIAYSQTRNHADAEDVAQETFLQAYRSLDSLRAKEKFEGWIATIARNTARTMWKRRQRAQSAADTVKPVEMAASPDAVTKELRELVKAKVDELDEAPREVLLLHYFAGKSTREIAAMLDISQSAVKKRLQRAREALSEELLGVLGESVEPERSFKDQTKTIMSAVLAAHVAWTTAGASAGALTFGGLLSGWKGIAAGAGFVVALGMVAAVGLRPLFTSDDSSDSPARSLDVAARVDDASTGEKDIEQPPDAGTADSQAESSQPPIIPASDELSEPPPSRQEELNEELTNRVGLVFEDIHVSEVFEFMAQTYEIPIALDGNVVAAPPPAPKVISPSHTHGGVGAFDGRSGLRPPAPTSSNAEPPAQRDEPETAIPNYATDGMVAAIDLRDVSLLEVFEAALYPLGLDFVEEPGFIWVSTPAMIQKEVQRMPDERYAAYPNLERLLKTTNASVVFNDTHVQEIMEFISETYEFNIALDNRVVAPPPSGDNELAKGHAKLEPGMVTDGMIPYINLSDIELRDALRAILRPLNVSQEVQNQYIAISTQQRLGNGFDTNELPVVLEMKREPLRALIHYEGEAHWYLDGAPVGAFRITELSYGKSRGEMTLTGDDGTLLFTSPRIKRSGPDPDEQV